MNPATISDPASRFDVGWRRSVIFTVGLVGLVATASDNDPLMVVLSVATSALGFGFFYVAFPGKAHFGIVTANLLAIYGCMFEFFRHANFDQGSRPAALVALLLPVVAFLIACLARRNDITRLIRARRRRKLDHLTGVSRWFWASMLVGAASFAVPQLRASPAEQDIYLLLAMALISGMVVLSLRDVVLVMVDIAMVFELVAQRVDKLLMPMVAFLTFYALMIVVFACLYRIADITTIAPQFMVGGEARRILFVEALHFSVVTMATVGYGDIVPTSMLVRALAGIEIISGVMMLLFGFSEIMRNAGPDSHLHRPRTPRRDSDTESP